MQIIWQFFNKFWFLWPMSSILIWFWFLLDLMQPLDVLKAKWGSHLLHMDISLIGKYATKFTIYNFYFYPFFPQLDGFCQRKNWSVFGRRIFHRFFERRRCNVSQSFAGRTLCFPWTITTTRRFRCGNHSEFDCHAKICLAGKYLIFYVPIFFREINTLGGQIIYKSSGSLKNVIYPK